MNKLTLVILMVLICHTVLSSSWDCVSDFQQMFSRPGVANRINGKAAVIDGSIKLLDSKGNSCYLLYEDKELWILKLNGKERMLVGRIIAGP